MALVPFQVFSCLSSSTSFSSHSEEKRAKWDQREKEIEAEILKRHEEAASHQEPVLVAAAAAATEPIPTLMPSSLLDTKVLHPFFFSHYSSMVREDYSLC